jgi:hypothetical protein
VSAEHESPVAAFARSVVAIGRDNTIDDWNATFDGKMSFAGARLIHDSFATMSEQQQAFVREVVVAVVDDAVGNALWALDRMPWLKLIAVDDATGEETRIEDLVDDLSSAFHGEDWVATCGRHPRSRLLPADAESA